MALDDKHLKARKFITFQKKLFFVFMSELMEYFSIDFLIKYLLFIENNELNIENKVY